MTRLTSSALLFAAFPLLLVVGCSSSDKTSTGKSAATASCDNGDNKAGDDCTCDDDSAGSYVCSDDALTCSCDGDTPTKTDAGGKKPTTPLKDGGTGTTKTDAKVPTGTTAPDADAGDDNTSPGTMTPVTTTGADPAIPAVSGTCPDFKTGTMTIGGLAGIKVEAGAKKTGTGSLVFYWHGLGSNAAEVDALLPAGVRNEILGQGGIIVSFDGSTKKGKDCSGVSVFYTGDFEIADLITACAVTNYGINPRQIYSTGCSAGGLTTGCMANERSSYIAAAVANSGGNTLPQQLQDPKHVPPTMTMHGDSADNFAGTVMFAQTSKALDDEFSKAGGFVMDCDHGGGHCAAPAELQTAGWQFMKDHPFGVAPDPYAGGIPGSFPKYCMKYP